MHSTPLHSTPCLFVCLFGAMYAAVLCVLASVLLPALTEVRETMPAKPLHAPMLMVVQIGPEWTWILGVLASVLTLRSAIKALHGASRPSTQDSPAPILTGILVEPAFRQALPIVWSTRPGQDSLSFVDGKRGAFRPACGPASQHTACGSNIAYAGPST